MGHNEDVVNHLLDNIGIAMEKKIRTSLLRSNIPAWTKIDDNIYDSIKHKVGNLSMQVGSDSPHGPFVEYGRHPGKMPPFDPIYQWVRNKITTDEPKAKNIAVAIQHWIGEKGVRPTRFLFKAIAEFVSENSL